MVTDTSYHLAARYRHEDWNCRFSFPLGSRKPGCWDPSGGAAKLGQDTVGSSVPQPPSPPRPVAGSDGTSSRTSVLGVRLPWQSSVMRWAQPVSLGHSEKGTFLPVPRLLTDTRV